MAFDLYEERLKDSDQTRVDGAFAPSYYALVWDAERPDSGTLRVDIDRYGSPPSPRFTFSIKEPDMEESPEQAAIPSNQLLEALGALERAGT